MSLPFDWRKDSMLSVLYSRPPVLEALHLITLHRCLQLPSTMMWIYMRNSWAHCTVLFYSYQHRGWKWGVSQISNGRILHSGPNGRWGEHWQIFIRPKKHNILSKSDGTGKSWPWGRLTISCLKEVFCCCWHIESQCLGWCDIKCSEDKVGVLSSRRRLQEITSS